jgi:hypothetical protein
VTHCNWIKGKFGTKKIHLQISSQKVLDAKRPKMLDSDRHFLSMLLSNHCLDPDPHGSAVILVDWIRIRIENADPDPGG